MALTELEQAAKAVAERQLKAGQPMRDPLEDARRMSGTGGDILATALCTVAILGFLAFLLWSVAARAEDSDPVAVASPSMTGLPQPPFTGLPQPPFDIPAPSMAGFAGPSLTAHINIPPPQIFACPAAVGVGYACTQPAANYPMQAPSNGPASTTPVPVSLGNQITALTGDVSAIAGIVDTNPADARTYNAPGGMNLIGGPLLTDAQAAALVVATQRSSVETGSDAQGNAAANAYYELNAMAHPTDYQAQLQSFWTANPGGWGGAWQRIDGAAPLGGNPTTAEILQWAAHKWGINPALLYAEATQEGDWNALALGDRGRSSGFLQVADRGTGHAFPGFSGAGANLSRENAAFNADFYAAHLWAAFHGFTNEGATQGNMGASIQSWFQGTVSGPGTYTAEVYSHLSTSDWRSRFFNGQTVPY